MFPKNIVSTDFKPLGKMYKGYSVVPSESVYYKRYPFKLVLESNLDNVDDFRDSVFMYGFNSLSERFRMYTNRNNKQLYLFLKTQKDLDTTLNAYSDLILEVHGPINKKHRENLLETGKFLSVRDKYYFGKYDCKVTIYRPWRHWGSMYSAPLMHSKKTNWYNELREFVVDQLGDKLYQHMSSSYALTFFVNKKDFNNVYPFVKMMYNDVDIYITECMIKE